MASSGINVLSGHIKELVQVMIGICCNQALDIKLRENATTFLVTIVENKPGQITKNNLLPTVIDCVTQLAQEECENAMNLEEASPQHFSVDILDAAIKVLPASMLLEPLLSLINELFADKQSPLRRKGGMIMLATMAEGLNEPLVPFLPQLVPTICEFVRTDTDAVVRGASCMTLTQFAENIGEPMCEFHELLIPTLMETSSGQLGESVALKGTVALGIMIEQMGEIANNYLDQVMEMCFTYFESDTVPIKMKEAVVTVLKACAKGVGEDFERYADKTLQLCAQAMTFTDNELLRLRAVCTEAAGDIGQACGVETWSRYHDIILPRVAEGFTLGYVALRECSFRFYCALGMIMGEAFSEDVELLNGVYELCHKALISGEGVEYKYRRDPTAGPTMFAQGENTDFNGVEAQPDDEEEEDMAHPHSFMIVTGVMDEKQAAAACLATMVEVGGPKIFAIAGRMMEALDELGEYPHPGPRATACAVMQELVQWFARYDVSTSDDEKQQNVLQSFLDATTSCVVPRLDEDECKEVITAANQCITETLSNFGADPFRNNNKLTTVCEQVMNILVGRHRCQESEEDVDEKLIKDHDTELMDSVTAIIPALAMALGSEMEDVFDAMVPALLAFSDPNRDGHDKAFAPGIFAECIPHLKELMPKYIQSVLQCCAAMMDEPEMVVKNNVFFCLGNIFLYIPELVADQDLTPFYNALIKQATADPLSFDTDPTCSTLHVRDNATAGIGKLLVSLSKNINVEEAIPVFLGNLPIRKDLEEAPFCMQALCQIFSDSMGDVKSYAGPAMNVLSQVLGIPEANLDEEMQQQLAALAKHIAETYPNQTQQAIQGMEEAHAGNLMAYIS
jgi:hypothetical protein